MTDIGSCDPCLRQFWLCHALCLSSFFLKFSVFWMQGSFSDLFLFERLVSAAQDGGIGRSTCSAFSFFWFLFSPTSFFSSFSEIVVIWVGWTHFLSLEPTGINQDKALLLAFLPLIAYLYGFWILTNRFPILTPSHGTSLIETRRVSLALIQGLCQSRKESVESECWVWLSWHFVLVLGPSIVREAIFFISWGRISVQNSNPIPKL